MGLWLPSEMTEQDQGPISGLKAQTLGRATTNAALFGLQDVQHRRCDQAMIGGDVMIVRDTDPSPPPGRSTRAVESAVAEILKVGDYVAGYGEQTSAIIATEKYSQVVTLEGVPPLTPRRLVAEFAIVRAGAGWTGFRDVVEVDGRKVEERKDRLERLLTEMTGSESDLMRIASENARFNVGPISRNLNVPTAALVFPSACKPAAVCLHPQGYQEDRRSRDRRAGVQGDATSDDCGDAAAVPTSRWRERCGWCLRTAPWSARVSG